MLAVVIRAGCAVCVADPAGVRVDAKLKVGRLMKPMKNRKRVFTSSSEGFGVDWCLKAR